MGSIIFVHGTGVRLEDYTKTFTQAEILAKNAGITDDFVECVWGPAYGVQFEGRSLPDSYQNEKEELQREMARWQWRFADPLFELSLLRTPANDHSSVLYNPSIQPECLAVYEEILRYSPSIELRSILQQNQLDDLWATVWDNTARTQIANDAFTASGPEYPEASHALAYAIVAELHNQAVISGVPAPTRGTRKNLIQRLLKDWNQSVFGLGTLLATLLGRFATHCVRQKRNQLSYSTYQPIGDILLYQSRGEGIRTLIKEKINEAMPPVTVLAHSLGGVACFDLLAMLGHDLNVRSLITVGSQPSFFYELGALQSLARNQVIPASFPRWLNIYDPNDFLSFVAEPLWPNDSRLTDFRVDSGVPFPESHSAYFGNITVWEKVRIFMEETDV